MMIRLWNGWCRWLHKPAVSVMIAVLACCGMPVLYGIMAEFVRIGSVYNLCNYIPPHLPQLLLGAVVTALCFGVLMLLTARPWVANLLVGGVLCFGSWANLQKLIYRGSPVLPKDLFQLSAAANIAQEMTFSVPRETWLFLLLLAGSTVALLPLRLPFGTTKRGWLARAALTLLAAAALPVYMKQVIYNKTFMADHGAVLAVGSMADTYYRSTFVTSFCMLSKSLLGEEAPEGYREQTVLQAAQLLLQDGSGAEQRECDVIVVLLESYFELFNYDTAQYSEPLHKNFERLRQQGLYGQMLTTEYGGGTANVEFGVLTGFSTGFLSAGSMPYVESIVPGFLCYPQYLKAMGYQTIALHPYIRSFYSRESSYPEMGIDTYVTEEAFSEEDVLGNYVADQATFDKALELYHQAAAGGPVFLHIVTMQNHGPNQPGEYAEDHAVKAQIPGESDYYNGCLSSVATSLRDVDRAVGNFVEALRQEERDIVVLFFGDHQTNINGDQGEDLLSRMEGYASLDADTKLRNSHVTPFLMWANFEIENAGTDVGMLPSYLLLPTMLSEYGVIRPAWMDWLYASVPQLQPLTFEILFKGEAAEAAMTERQKEIFRAQKLLQYDLMFGERYAEELLYPVPQG